MAFFDPPEGHVMLKGRSRAAWSEGSVATILDFRAFNIPFPATELGCDSKKAPVEQLQTHIHAVPPHIWELSLS